MMRFIQAEHVSALRLTGRARLVVALVSTIAALGVLGGAPSTSRAALSDCSHIYGQGTLCLWRDAQYSGTLWAFNPQLGTPQQQWLYVGSTINDQTSSLYNYRNVWVSWVSADWRNSATQACLGLGEPRADLSYNLWPAGSGGGANDSISSLEMSNQRTSCPSGTGFIQIQTAVPPQQSTTSPAQQSTTSSSSFAGSPAGSS